VAAAPPAPAEDPATIISATVRTSRMLIPASHRPNPFGMESSVATTRVTVNGSIVPVAP
jgi:hypothetical protein